MYAKRTRLDDSKSRADIERELRRFKCTEFGFLQNQKESMVAFKTGIFSIRISLPHEPDEQKMRARWRALLLVIKAKLVAVETGISTIEKEFLAFVVTSNGRTVYQNVESALLQQKPVNLLGMSDK